MVDVVLPLECCDIRPSEGTTALVAKQTKPSEVVRLTEGILSLSILVVRGEELGGYYLPTILSNNTR